jgi:hypothetical protein
VSAAGIHWAWDQLGHADKGETARRHYIKPDHDRVLQSIRDGLRPVTPLRAVRDESRKQASS